MIPQSIRWRLPLTYAGIALLAVLLLGGILLTTLRGFYLQNERDYLNRNASAISISLSNLTQAGLPLDLIKSQLDNFAFLSQSRISLFDLDGNVLAQTDIPFRTNISFFSARIPPGIDQPLAVEGGVISETSWVQIYEPGQDVVIPGFDTVVPLIGISPFPGDQTAFVDAQRTEGPLGTSVIVTRTGTSITSAPGDYLIDALAVSSTPFGFDLGVDTAGVPRSDVIVRKPYYNSPNVSAGDRQAVGYVELSDGPAYGREILSAVTMGWLIAGSASVVLAALAGWLISRRLSKPLMALTGVTSRMATGDLSARADVTRRDEVGTLARSFNDMAGRVEETIVTLRRFVADAAHELHTPLTALHTNLELATNDAQTQNAFIQRAQIQADRLETLVDGLLNLSRIEANEEEHVTIDLRELIQQASEVYASRAEQNGVAFELDLPSYSIEVSGHAARLRRAFGNLMDNALKFTAPGGSIHVRLQSHDEWIETSVEDTGIGIPADDLPQLFERFHRARNATAYPGNGLGLAIVKAIVDEHHGQVHAENLPHGVRFSIRLPS